MSTGIEGWAQDGADQETSAGDGSGQGNPAGPASHDASAATPLPPVVEANFDSVYAFLEAGGRPQGRERRRLRRDVPVPRGQNLSAADITTSVPNLPPDDRVGGGKRAHQADLVGACGGPGTITYAYSYRPGIPAYLTPDPQPTTQPPVEWPRSGEGTNGEAVDTTRDRARAEFENDPDQYGSVIARIDCLLGGDSVDPTGLCIKIPSCDGETYETCRARLLNAGFTGTITKHTLSADDAIMEEQADITVYVNPEPMPTMTATETAIAVLPMVGGTQDRGSCGRRRRAIRVR